MLWHWWWTLTKPYLLTEMVVRAKMMSHCKGSLVPRPHLSQGKRSGEPSRISFAYYRNVVRTNEIAIITKNTLYSQAPMHKGARLFSTFSFWLDKWMLHCGDKCWNDFLHLIMLVFKNQEMQLSPHKNMQREPRSLTICWIHGWHVSSCSFFPASKSTAYMHTICRAHVDCQKRESDSLNSEGDLKCLLCYPRAGVSGRWYIVHLLSQFE